MQFNDSKGQIPPQFVCFHLEKLAPKVSNWRTPRLVKSTVSNDVFDVVH